MPDSTCLEALACSGNYCPPADCLQELLPCWALFCSTWASPGTWTKEISQELEWGTQGGWGAAVHSRLRNHVQGFRRSVGKISWPESSLPALWGVWWGWGVHAQSKYGHWEVGERKMWFKVFLEMGSPSRMVKKERYVVVWQRLGCFASHCRGWWLCVLALGMQVLGTHWGLNFP